MKLIKEELKMQYKYLKIKIKDVNDVIFITEDMIINNTFLKTQTVNNSLEKLEEEGLISIEFNKTTNKELHDAIKNEDYNKIRELLGDI